MAEERHELTLDAEGLDERFAGRAFLGRRRRLRIPDALPGERVQLTVLKRGARGRPDLARLEQVRDAHPGRQDVACPRHASRVLGAGCSGCSLLHATWSLQRELKRRWLAEHLGFEVGDLIHGRDPVGYRWSSKRVAVGAAGSLALGSYVRGAHEVASMAGCLVDHDRIVDAAAELEEVAGAQAWRGWDEAAGTGDLRYVWFKTNGHQVMTTLVTGVMARARVERLATALTLSATVAWSVQDSQGNDMRGEGLEVLRGPARLSLPDAVGGGEVGPLGFLQPNPEVAWLATRSLLHDERGEALRGALAWDLYAGGGATTRGLQGPFQRVEACDRLVDAPSQSPVLAMDVETFLAAREAGARPDLIVANPPRGGLGDDVARALCRVGAARVHLMSCNPSSLRRDLTCLQEHADYRIASVEAFDTLPHTEHVELVVRLARDGPNDVTSS